MPRGRAEGPAGAEYGVALVGHGYSGRTLHLPLIETTRGLRLRSVVSSQPGPFGLDRQAPAASLEAALADPAVDLVVIATPTATHAALAERALLAGKHVVVDKPLAADAAGAERLAALAERLGLVLTVFHNRRWDADFLTLKSLIAQGALGEIRYFESRWSRYRPLVRDRWRERAGPGAGVWFDLGSHVVDQALQLFGEPAWVMADISAQRNGPDFRAPDFMHVVLGYASGLRAVLHGSSLAPGPEPRFIVHGLAGSFLKTGFDRQEAALAAGERPGGRGWGDDSEPGRLTLAVEGASSGTLVPGVPGDWPAFYDGVRAALTRAPPPVSAAEAATVVRVVELAVRSADQGRRLAWTDGATQRTH